ncbi:MAG: hypothetical protein WCB33_09935 [Bradyrhizobium sp.]|uniref:hypothetical protein n=1 Tax=Bradyrhizobium sp. TaxID=376 RepID=UPI003C4AB7D9
MRLTTRSNILDQSLGIEPVAVFKDWSRNVDAVVEGEFFDDIHRGVGRIRETFGQACTRRDFDRVGQPADDFSENPDLVFGVTTDHQHICGVPQCSLTALGRSPAEQLRRDP